MREPMSFLPYGFTSTTMDILNPKKSVIVDMIMVQILSLIITFSILLIFANQQLNASDLSYIMGGLFGALMFLTAVYSRLSH